jgi:hypothetical protein
VSGYGYHWTPCKGSGGIGLGGVAALVILAEVVANRQAIETGLADLLELALAVAGGLLVVGGTVAVLVFRSRRRARTAAAQPRPVALTAHIQPVQPPGPAQVTAPRRGRPAIAAPRSNTPTYPRKNVNSHVVTGPASVPSCSRRADRRS